MIEKFRVTNYKNLAIGQDELNLKKINILIGSNGSGKSNFIDSIVFFKDLLKFGLQQTVAKRKFDEVLNKYSDEHKISFSISLNTEKQYSTLKYEADIFIHQMTTYFLKENISYDKPGPNRKKPFNFIKCHDKMPEMGSFPIREEGKTKAKNIRISRSDTIFRQSENLTKNIIFATKIFPTFSKVIDDIKEYVSTWRYFSMSEINLDDFKKPLKITGKRDELNSSLNNFADFIINNMDIIDRLKNYFNLDVRFEILPQGEYLQIFPVINDKRFLMSSLSDGQMRILLLLTIFYLDKLSMVVFLDEPELNLHTSWLLKLKHDIYNSNKQLFISTHAADLLDVFTEDFLDGKVNILVFESGRVKVLQNNEILSKEIDRGFELGDLYRSGDPLIGGWDI
ncbi:MAG: AAA family ATPase [Desulfonauticus sp.]|nr:AAA family ATPase [Desulfonauticus sp.]